MSVTETRGILQSPHISNSHQSLLSLVLHVLVGATLQQNGRSFKLDLDEI